MATKIRWHQNDNVYWADFRPNYRKPPPKPVDQPGNEVPNGFRGDLGRQLDVRLNQVLLDTLQSHERILRSIEASAGRAVEQAMKGSAVGWARIIEKIEGLRETRRAEIVEAVIEGLRQELGAARPQLREHPRRSHWKRAVPLGAVLVSVSLAASAAIPDTLAQPNIYEQDAVASDSEEGKLAVSGLAPDGRLDPL